MTDLIAVVAFVLTGPLVGVELGVAAFTNPLVSELPDDAYRVFRSGGSRLLGALMPFWYIGTLVVLIGAAVEDATRFRVALEPRAATFELASRLDRSHAMPLAGVLGHASHLRPDSPGSA